MRTAALIAVGIALVGCTPMAKEPRVCTKEELHVKSLTKHQYEECIDGQTISGEFIAPMSFK